MLYFIVEKIDEPAPGGYQRDNGFFYDSEGDILCFKVSPTLDKPKQSICDFMYKNKHLFGEGWNYKGIRDLIQESTSGSDLYDKIQDSRIDGDSEAIVEFLRFNTDNVPIKGSEFYLRLEYSEEGHNGVEVKHDSNYDNEDDEDGEDDEGVYCRKLNPDYCFEVDE